MSSGGAHQTCAGKGGGARKSKSEQKQEKDCNNMCSRGWKMVTKHGYGNEEVRGK